MYNKSMKIFILFNHPACPGCAGDVWRRGLPALPAAGSGFRWWSGFSTSHISGFSDIPACSFPGCPSESARLWADYPAPGLASGC